MPRIARQRRTGAIAASLGVAFFAGCATHDNEPTAAAPKPAEVKSMIERLMPDKATDRAGWATDIYAAFAAENLDPSKSNVCAVLAVIDQESGFRVDPVVPGMGAIAWKEIDRRAASAGVPSLLVHAALQLPSPNGRSYSERIDAARTERDLSDVFEDFIGRVPMGTTLFGDANPIRTRGPMQVNVAFVTRYGAAHPYPYPVAKTLAEESFGRRGGVYFGVAHLLDYPAAYDQYLYRFADYNAGQYSSRNAAFQRAVTSASGIPVVPDGALLPANPTSKNAGSTELAIGVVAARLGLSPSEVHDDLGRGRGKDLESTQSYRRVYELAERNEGRSLPREAVPQIQLGGPKITRDLSTEWYANRVNGRFESCLAR